MSEPSAQPAPAIVESGFATLRARAGLAERKMPLDDSDLVDWADLCLAAGHCDEARLLHHVAAIRAGFSRQLVAAQDARGRSTGLWEAKAGPPRSAAPGNVVDIALADLKAFAVASARRPARPAERHVADNIEAAAHRIHAIAPSVSPQPFALHRAIGALFERLREAPDAPDRSPAVVAALRDAVRVAPNFDPRTLAGAPLPLLASAIAFQAIEAFLIDHRDLMDGERGSFELFARAARFDSFGLGPYFGGVAQVVRRCRDILELAGIAFETAARAGDGISLDHWIVLLSRSIAGPLLDEVIDELGDANRSEALGGILDRLLMAPAARTDWSRVMRVRDAALDNLDYPLASRAQRAVAESQPGVILEWSILGTIDGAGGRIPAAEQRFQRCLELDPDDRDPLDRIVALKSGAFGAYAITKGFSTPEDRQLGRLRRREGRDVAQESERKSAIGVQVNY